MAGTQHLESAKKPPLQPHQPQHWQLQVSRPVMGGLPQYPGPTWPTLNRKATIGVMILITEVKTRARATSLAVSLIQPLSYTCLSQTILACKFLLPRAICHSMRHPLPYLLATTRPHARRRTRLECAQFSCLSTSWCSYKTFQCPPLLLHPTKIVAPHTSLWQTLGVQITCYPTRLPSSPIVRLTIAGFGWAIISLLLFWVRVQLSLLSMANESLFETAYMSPLFATRCTASAPTTTNMAVGSLGCIT
jgi:hypothetical protein